MSVKNTITEIPNFPFASFEEFVEAYAAGRAGVWTDVGSPGLSAIWTAAERRYLQAWMLSPIWIAVGFAGAAWLRRDAWLLLGAPAALLGILTASPNMNLINGCLSFVAALAGIIGSLALGRGDLIAVSVGACAALVLRSCALDGAHMDIRRRMTQSEDAFLRLYEIRAIGEIIKMGPPPQDPQIWPPEPDPSQK